MRTIQIDLYKFDELGKEAKQQAIADHRNWENEHGEPLMFFEEDCKEYLNEQGFSGVVVRYSLTYSQGDGLSFYAGDYDKLKDLFIEVLGKGKEKTAKAIIENCELKISGNTGRYAFPHKSDVRLYTDKLNVKLIDGVIQQVEGKLQEIYLNACKHLEKQGYEQIRYSTTDEAIIQHIKANEYEYEKDGTKY